MDDPDNEKLMLEPQQKIRTPIDICQEKPTYGRQAAQRWAECQVANMEIDVIIWRVGIRYVLVCLPWQHIAIVMLCQTVLILPGQESYPSSEAIRH